MQLRLTRGHPRLFITPARLPEFKCLSAGPRREYFAKLLERLEPALVSPLALRANIRSHPEGLALALGQAWRLTRDSRYGVAARWLLEGLEQFIHGHPIGYDTWGAAAEAAGLLYDWLHDYWRAEKSLEQTARMALYCARRALDEALRLYILEDWHNYSLGLQSGALAAALAVGAEWPRHEDGTLLKTLQKLHFTGLEADEAALQDGFEIPKTTRCLERALRAQGNAFFSGLAEATGGYHGVDLWELVKIAEWWTSAVTFPAMLAPAARGRRIVWPELELAGAAILHSIRPDGRFAPVGDSKARPPHSHQARAMLYLHARTPRPEFADFLSEYAHTAGGPYPTHLLLRAPPKPAPKKPPAPALPTIARFEPLVFMRGSWNRDAAFATFRCGRYGGGHNHLDSNAFSIFRGGPLAIDSGEANYSVPAYTEYVPRTLAHNAIVVVNPGEPHWIGRHGLPTANDGGQRLMRIAYHPPERFTGNPLAVLTEERRERLADRFDTGHYVGFEPGPLVDYVAGDATRAYTYPWSGLGDNPSRRVEEVVRQILFIKPDIFVVFDRVEATRAHYQKKWLLHTSGAPTAYWGKRRKIAARGVRELPPDALLEFAAQRGRLTVFPLLPEARAMLSIGGRGYEGWVCPAAGAPQGMNYPPGEAHAESGAWRVEIAPREPRIRDCFLNVLHAGLRRETPARETLRCSAEWRGSEVELLIERRWRGAWREAARAGFRTDGRIAAAFAAGGSRGAFSAPAPRRVPRARG